MQDSLRQRIFSNLETSLPELPKLDIPDSFSHDRQEHPLCTGTHVLPSTVVSVLDTDISLKFELHIRDFVDIRKVPDMPSKKKKDEYNYEACDLIPPIGEHLMAHFFHHPDHANNESALILFRTPKKRKQKLTVYPTQGVSVGWGIHLVEGWAPKRVWLLILVFFLIGSIVFGICWSILKKDLQGAFAMSAYVVALIGLVLGTMTANSD